MTIDLDNPPEEAKPYVALYEERMKAIRSMQHEISMLRSQLIGMTGERDDERKISQEWEEKYNALEERVRGLIDTFG